MIEIFQNYKHYSQWILENYERTGSREFTLHIEKELLIKKEVNCSGQSHRQFTEEEFNSKNFIKIPKNI